LVKDNSINSTIHGPLQHGSPGNHKKPHEF
jgi:hypothetical protein